MDDQYHLISRPRMSHSAETLADIEAWGTPKNLTVNEVWTSMFAIPNFARHIDPF